MIILIVIENKRRAVEFIFGEEIYSSSTTVVDDGACDGGGCGSVCVCLPCK